MYIFPEKIDMNINTFMHFAQFQHLIIQVNIKKIQNLNLFT